MKTRAVLLLVMMCLPMVFAFGPPVTGDGPQLVITDVQRNAHFEEYGMVLFTDTITVYNPGPEPAFSVFTAYPLTKVDEVKGFRAETVNGTELHYQRVPLLGTNSSGWEIFLSEPIMPYQDMTFVTQMAVEGLTSQTSATATLVFSIVPTSPYFIQEYETTLTYHYALTAATQELWSGDNVHPFSYIERTVVLDFMPNDFLPLVTYVELHRSLTVDPWGYLQVHEVHSLRVDSPNPDFASSEQKWTNITLTLPPGSEFLRTYDQVANLSSIIGRPANATHPGVIYVSFQYHLQKDDIYTIYLDYRIPLDQRQIVLQTGLFLNLQLNLEYPFRIEKQVTEILLPVGSWLQDIPLGAQVTIATTGQYLISITSSNVTSITNNQAQLFYVYPVSPALARPLLLFLIAALFCLGYIAVRRIPYFREEEEISAVVADVDPAILSEFCALYGEKIALLLQTERLEQTMLQGKISKPRYRKEKKNFERKLRTLDRDLSGRSQPLIEAGGKYESSVRQLELLEAERVSSIEALHALEQRYRQKRITASVYQKLQKDLQKRRDKSVSRMDRILLSLREEISE
ncbi:MAG: hypothetical protein ACFFDU_09510 [Candidatus Thorarchaeota archaeon]